MNTVQLPGFSLDLSGLEPVWTKLGAATPDWIQQGEALTHLFDTTVGFFHLPAKISEAELSEIETFARSWRSRLDGVLLFGIGGSHLGPALIQDALRTSQEREDFRLCWLSNVDPAAIRNAEWLTEKHRLGGIAISKSGNTVETLAGFFHLHDRLVPDAIAAITDPKSGALRAFATENGWKTFPVPPEIGGRFSVFSAVGLVPIALGGVSIRKFVGGAKAMRDQLVSASPEDNPAYQFAHVLHALDQGGYSQQYLMPYWSSTRFLADWFVQLWGESLGKKQRGTGKAVGPTAIGALGTTDQHSLLQLFKEGPSNKVVGFVDVLAQGTERGPIANTRVATPKFNTGEFQFLGKNTFEKITHEALLATQKSLSNASMPTYRIEIPVLDEHSLGALLFFFETACAFAGELYNVNAFDQPGVEEAKKLLRAAL